LFCTEAGIFVERVEPSLFARLSKLDDCAKFEGELRDVDVKLVGLVCVEADSKVELEENDAGFGNDATVGKDDEAGV